MSLSKPSKALLLVAAFLLGSLFIFPPWKREYSRAMSGNLKMGFSAHVGHDGPVWESSEWRSGFNDGWYTTYSVDFPILSLEIGALLITLLALISVIENWKRVSEGSPNKKQ